MNKKQTAVALWFVVPALAVGACGGDSDKDKITTLIEDISDKPATLCDNATKNLLKQTGGKEGCRKAAEGSPEETEVKVKSVDVNGDRATAEVTSEIAGKETKNQKVKFVKEDGDWKVDG